jgi:HlyD family secretion protein
MKKVLICLTIVFPTLIVAAALLWSMGVFARTLPVDQVEVSMARLQRSVTTNGKVEAEKAYELRAPAAGICRRTAVYDAVRLNKGQEILRIEDPSLPSQMAAARAELDAARVDLRDIQRGPSTEESTRAESEVARANLVADNARKLLQENEWLLARNAITRFEVEQNRRSLAEAEQALSAAQKRQGDLKHLYGDLDLQRAQARVAAAETRIRYLMGLEERLIVRAPADGTLHQYTVKDGAYLNTGDLIGLLADLTRLRLRAYVDEPDVGQVAVGEKVVIRWDAHPLEEWHGEVVRMPVQVVPLGTRSVAEVICSIENPHSTLLSNTNVDVEIEAPEGSPMMSLPRGVVFPEGSKEFVWVIEKGKAARRYIETGRSTNARIEILRGLALGDKVIDPVDDLISEGLKVQARTR